MRSAASRTALQDSGERPLSIAEKRTDTAADHGSPESYGARAVMVLHMMVVNHDRRRGRRSMVMAMVAHRRRMVHRRRAVAAAAVVESSARRRQACSRER